VTAPWDPMPSREWDTGRTRLTETGVAWPEEFMRHDLRWWAAKVRLGYASRIPGARTLAADWGVSRKVAARVMRDEAGWMDPRFAQEEGTTTGPERAASEPRKGPPEPQQDAIADKGGESAGPEQATTEPPKGHTRGDTHHTTPQAQNNSSSPDGDSAQDLVSTWERIQARRSAHLQGTKGQSFSPDRRKNLAARLKELRRAGLTSDDLVRAVDWVFTSPSSNADGARKGDAVATLLRRKHCVAYVERAAEESGPTPADLADLDTPADPDAWVAERLPGLREGWRRAESENPRNPNGPFGRMLRQRVTNHRDVAAAFWRAEQAGGAA